MSNFYAINKNESKKENVLINMNKSKWGIVKKHFIKKKDPKKDVIIRNWQSLAKNVRSDVYIFLGFTEQEDDKAKIKAKWDARLKQLYGKGGVLSSATSTPKPVVEFPNEDSAMLNVPDGIGYDSVDFASRKRYQKNPVKLKNKENVVKMAYKVIKHKKHAAPGIKNRSFQRSDLINQKMKENNLTKKERLDTNFFGIDKPSFACMNIGEGDFTDNKDQFIRLKNGFLVKKRDIEKQPLMKVDFDEIDGVGKNASGGRIEDDLIDGLINNTNRGVALGTFGKHVLQTDTDTSKIDKETAKQFEEIGDMLHRPFFTYWVTFVQVICYIVAVCVYGIAPIGFDQTLTKAEVLSSGLFLEDLQYYEKDNFWIGPRQADLIHLGAKYSPCMRKDTNIEKAILEDRHKENMTACCIRNDGAGCVQSPKSKCSSILSTWKKWEGIPKKSSSVCGQDPNYCLVPASREPYQWSDSIVEWPICLTKSMIPSGAPDHMTCDISGRPCCVGIQGECYITTREDCTFKRGYFHEEATLCSQISCLDQTCGMLSFWNANSPDQIYRLWTSLFIHAGLIQLVISILFQYFIMRDVEKLIGWLRISIVYILSGIAGSLASAIFTPYHVEAGPSGSQFGIIACLFVELIHSWKMVNSPCLSFTKLSLMLLILFIMGLLPMIDNYAHLFGFFFGFILSYALMPHVEFNITRLSHKILIFSLCFFGSLLIIILLFIFFYVLPIYSCDFCKYFTCLPIKEGFCDTMEIKIRRSD